LKAILASYYNARNSYAKCKIAPLWLKMVFGLANKCVSFHYAVVFCYIFFSFSILNHQHAMSAI